MNVSFLKPLYTRPGPFASAYLDASGEPKAVELRWRALRRDLIEQGAPEETVGAIESLIERRSQPGTLAIFASGDEVAYHETLPGPPAAEQARFSPLPHVRPLLAQRGEPVPHLVAVVTRRGGRIAAWDRHGVRREADIPPEEDYPVHKSKSGDSMRQARNQRVAEDNWRANAKKFAHAITDAAGACGAEVVAVAGDVRIAAEVREDLPEPVLSRTALTGPAGPALEEEVARVVERKREERVLAEIDRFHEALAGRRAVEGPEAAAWALRQAKVACLLLADVPGPPALLWTGPQPAEVAATGGDLLATGVAWPFRDRADAALIRALAATDGELLLAPPGALRADRGIGALLRSPG